MYIIRRALIISRRYMYIETICVTFHSLKLTYVKLPYKFTSQISPKKAFRIPTHCHPLETFPESVSQSFLHGISDIRHLILVNVYIVRFDKFLKKKKMMKILKCEMFPRCLKKVQYM